MKCHYENSLVIALKLKNYLKNIKQHGINKIKYQIKENIKMSLFWCRDRVVELTWSVNVKKRKILRMYIKKIIILKSER